MTIDNIGEKSNSINYVIVLLMMAQPILGATSLGWIQIIDEITLWLLLIYGVSKIKLNRLDIFLIVTFGIASAGSLVLNDLHTFFLNFKIYGLCIFTLIYFRKIYFNPKKLIFFFLILNIVYAILARNLNIWIIESLPFFQKTDTYLYSRPVGFLGSPHATSTFLVLCFLYYFNLSKNYILQIVIFYVLLLYASWTVFLAMIINIFYLALQRVFKIFIHPIIFLGLGLVMIYLSMDMIFSFAGEIENSRAYSLDIMLPMIFNSDFYQGIFPFFPKNHDLFILKQEAFLATVGNELGFIKIFVEGGLFLAITILYALYRRTRIFSIIFIVTLFHYSFFVNMPFILYLAMTFNKEILFNVGQYKNEMNSYNKNLDSYLGKLHLNQNLY